MDQDDNPYVPSEKDTVDPPKVPPKDDINVAVEPEEDERGCCYRFEKNREPSNTENLFWYTLTAGEVELPQSLYTYAILRPLGWDGCSQYCATTTFSLFVIIYSVLLVVLNCVIQIGFFLYIPIAGKGGVHPYLLFCSLCAFNVYFVAEINETVAMICWVLRFKIEERWKPIELVPARDRFETGMVWWYKALALFALVIKMAIAFGLAVRGIPWLLGSESNADILLNCVSLYFITQIDEAMYSAFVSSGDKELMRKVPNFRWEKETQVNSPLSVVLSYLGMWGPILTVAISVAFSISPGSFYAIPLEL